MLCQLQLKFGTSQDGRLLGFDPRQITVFVGPNNAGKSLCLREVLSCLLWFGPRQADRRVVNFIEPDLPTPEEAESLVLRQAESRPASDHSGHHHALWKNQKYLVDTANLIKQLSVASQDQKQGVAITGEHKASVLHHFVSQLTIELDGPTRLSLVSEADLGDLQVPATNHLATLFRDDDARNRVRKLVAEAFGRHFVLDPTNLGKVRVRLAARPPADPAEEQGLDRRARDYHAAAAPVSDFSDGVKAYTGVVAALASSDYRVVFIDEPEAFQHPPLARRLGKIMADLAAERAATVFAATHSVHYLMGCIASRARVNVVRLTYAGTARLLPHDRLLMLMRDPLLRAAKTLDALFAAAAVVCEADADRAFYEEINRRLAATGRPAVADSVFLNAQNKGTVRRLVKPLRELGVPAAAVVDLDILETGPEFKKLLDDCFVPEVTAQGWASTRGHLLAEFGESKPELKRRGLDRFEGDNREAATKLLADLCEYGIFVVPLGELERWLRHLGAVGQKDVWLPRLFEKLGSDPQAADYVHPGDGDVWAFVGQIAAWAADPHRKGMPAGS